ncbi:MAG: ribonuclease D, partial [Alphaproteobacteria bacterium]
TYWPQLCLVQVAAPEEAATIDPLAEGIDLGPLFDVMAAPGVIKVFHAARQDIEIFHHLNGAIPKPLFDTQVAAMVCGFGESVGYETLATKLAHAKIDKSMRFTDWSHRPLTDRQLHYALSDVTHLRVAYEKLAQQLVTSGRTRWLDEEMAILTNPATYLTDPADAWRRLKTRSSNPRFLAVLKELAAWRESEAQGRDVTRNRVLRDDTLLDIAAHRPRSREELLRTRGIDRNSRNPEKADNILAAVARGMDIPNDQCPRPAKPEPLPKGLGATLDLLKVLLKMKCEAEGVAQKLVANSADLERIAVDDDAPVAALSGWRRELFGDDALALKHGERALAIDGNVLRLIPANNSVGATRDGEINGGNSRRRRRN